MKLVTAAQMRELEAAAVAAGVTERQLMEEAGLAVAQEAWMTLGTLEGRRIVALVGPGNNGGDGIVAARHLYDWGAEATLYIPRRRRDMTLVEELAPREMQVVAGEDDAEGQLLEQLLNGCDLVIDALLGIVPLAEASSPGPSGDEVEIEALVLERTEAKKSKDFARADQIRDELLARGIELRDTPDGVKWRKL